MSDPIKSIGEQIVDLFNAALIQQGVEAAYTLEDLTIGEPVAYEPGSYDESNPEAHNTWIPVSAGTGADKVDFNLHYTRLTIAGLLAKRATSIEGTGDETSTYDLLDTINELIKFELTVDDVTDEVLTEANGITAVVIKANPASLAVTGQGSLVVEAAGSNPQARVAPQSFSAPVDQTDGSDDASADEGSSEPTETSTEGDATEGGEQSGTEGDDAEQA